jgi:hypothetical protein
LAEVGDVFEKGEHGFAKQVVTFVVLQGLSRGWGV